MELNIESNIKSIPTKIKELILYKSPLIKTPFNNNIKVLFADYTATGKASPLIEKYVTDHVLPYYSNTHSNAYLGCKMKDMISETKQYMRKHMNINKSKKIIFDGSGTTGVINHLVYCLKLEDTKNDNMTVNIFVSSIEHHSNYLPWIELSKKSSNIRFNVIPSKDNFDIDLGYLENKIKNSDDKTFNIVSITACSNVLGIKINTRQIYDMLQKYNICECCYGKKNLLFVDYACSAPYIKIDASISDALFFSPHKFLGGHSIPGVLIANKELFHNTIPYNAGGSCVKKVCSQKIEYENDIEKRESSGTPNIIGIIKLKKVLQLKNMFLSTINYNEKAISKYVFNKFKLLDKKYANLTVVLPEYIEDRLPIVCIAIKDIHYNFIVCLLNDLFGIQTRGGVSCTGLLVELIEKTYGISGWCRITFNWLMDQKEVDYIIYSVVYIINNIDKYNDQYYYNKKTNLFVYKII